MNDQLKMNNAAQCYIVMFFNEDLPQKGGKKKWVKQEKWQ